MTEIKVSKATLVRFALVFVVIINLILEKFGIGIEVSTDYQTISQAIDCIISIAVIVVGFWYNNSFSTSAIQADKVKSVLDGDDIEKVNKIIKFLNELEQEESNDY